MPAPRTSPPDFTLTEVPTLLAESDGWADLRSAVRGGQSGGIDGAWGSSAAAAVVALARELDAPVLVVVPHLTDIGPWQEDLSSFAGVRPTVFPAYETWPVVERAGKIAPETGGRLRVLQTLSLSPGGEGPGAMGAIVLAPIAAVVQPVPPRGDLAARGRRITVGDTLDPDEFAAWLLEAGYKRAEAVEFAGEFGRRGGILDLFPPDASDPVRLEFFGDELESIRTFTAQTQRSLEKKTDLTVLALNGPAAGRSQGFVLDYFPPGSVVVLVEPADLKEQAKHFFERVADVQGLFTTDGTFANLMTRPTVTVSALPRASVEATAHLRIESVERFSGNVQKVRDELDAVAHSDRVLIACQTEAEVHRLTEVLKAGKLAESDRLRIVTGHVRHGFRVVGGDLTPRPPLQRGEGVFKGDTESESSHAGSSSKGKSRKRPPIEHPLSTLERGPGGEVSSSGLVVLGSHELFHKELLPPGVKDTGRAGRRIESRAIDSFLDLADGDYVVHVAHGIARFRGMRMLEKGVSSQQSAVGDDGDQQPAVGVEEHLILEFRDGVLLYVPASRIDLVQRYVGGQHAEPELSKLGGTAWGRKKDKVTEAVMDMAAEMIQIQAVRATLPGFAFPADSDWQTEFDGSFPYQETPDQATSITEIKADLEKPRPMDRLLCGDVGYGKTEVAVRAAFKAIDNGKQVAVLVPTTVLAEQHFRTFRERLAEYPFTVECLNRYRSPKQQRDIVKRLAEGTVDVVVGTHRLVSEGVKFKDLGLVIIDEEQRFGVEHKERLKRLRTSVHILTMTATPIPRTLHSALLGVREISSLETAPPGRFPVETRIVRWDDALVRNAIHREFNRGGQVYFVHNRVYDIWDVAAKLQAIVPDAKIVVGHGQMGEGELEQAMVKFVNKEADILVATTIIESGLDIPNANTIFIDDADLYGLADLHQLRGRVGRTKLRAYAYLIVDPLKMVSPNAQKRLKAIEEFTALGSGFKIAMRDLEIRGAGNILGTEQSGHIAAVGYEMYCQLLENAVRQLKHQPPKEAVQVNVDLPWPAFLPKDYVPGQKLRIEVYRRLARLRDPAKLADFRQELRDRYGPPPEAVEWLLRTTEVRLLCVRWQVGSVHRNGPDLIFGFRNRKKADTLDKLTHRRIKVVDEKNLYLRLKPEEDSPPAMYELLTRLLNPPRLP
jgi:transcription-repair coupling factor (superfamily II helicase)